MSSRNTTRRSLIMLGAGTLLGASLGMAGCSCVACHTYTPPGTKASGTACSDQQPESADGAIARGEAVGFTSYVELLPMLQALPAAH